MSNRLELDKEKFYHLEWSVGHFLRKVSELEYCLRQILAKIMGLDDLAIKVIAKNMDLQNFWQVFKQYIEEISSVIQVPDRGTITIIEEKNIVRDALNKMHANMNDIRGIRNDIAHGDWCELDYYPEIITTKREKVFDNPFPKKNKIRDKIQNGLEKISELLDQLKNFEKIPFIMQIKK